MHFRMIGIVLEIVTIIDCDNYTSLVLSINIESMEWPWKVLCKGSYVLVWSHIMVAWYSWTKWNNIEPLSNFIMFSWTFSSQTV